MERIWRIWCNIYANHVKDWSLKLPKLCSSSFSWHYFCFHKHFREGPCSCGTLGWGGENFEVRGNVSGDDGECLCVQARGQLRFPTRRDVRLLGVQSGSQSDVVSWDFGVELDMCGKRFRLPFGPQEQKGLTFWWKSDLTEKNETCVNRAQPFVDVSKRGLNRKPDFYLPEYLLNVMKQKDEIDVKL